MQSMTGFGKGMVETENYQVTVELKSINHRFLDIQCRLPKELSEYELLIRQQVKDELQRGRVEVYVNLVNPSQNNQQVVVNWPLIDQLDSQLTAGLEQRQAPILELPQLLPLLLQQADFITVKEVPLGSEEVQPLVATAVKMALTSLKESRQVEGEKLQAVIRQYQRDFSEVLVGLQSFVAIYEEDYRQRFETKLQTLLGEHVAKERLLTELAILIERGDIHEELDRLVIHGEKLQALLEEEQPVGRELDFLLQEMNREVNTIGSKSTAIEIKNQVVQMKTILEKIREQIQNIE